MTTFPGRLASRSSRSAVFVPALLLALLVPGKPALGQAPQVNNTSGASVVVGQATLRGNLTSVAPADIYIYWGRTDVGATTNWEHLVTLPGTPQGAFSTNVNAGYGFGYSYRCWASNGSGTAWATSSPTFSLVNPLGPSTMISTSQLTNVWTKDQAGGRAGTLAFNGTGMADADHHNTNPGHMWLANGSAPSWIMVQLGATYAIDYLRIWNYNEYGAVRSVKDADFYVSTTGFGNNTSLSGASFDATGWTRVLQNQILQPATGLDNATNTDPHISLNFAAASHLAITVLSTYSDIPGLSEVQIYAFPGFPASIANTGPTGVTTSAASLNAQLNGAGWAFDVYVGWGTNNAGTNLGAWATNKFLGTFNNATGTISHTVTIAPSNQYYYTFFASNAVTNLCAQPSWAFSGNPPTVSNTTAAPYVGYANLAGAVQNANGASVKTYWGTTNCGTTNSAWEFVITNGVMSDGAFASNTPTSLLYGRQYYYRCYASNSLGEAWALAATPFLTAFPRGQIPASQIGTNVITQNEVGGRQGYKAFDGTGMLDADYHDNNPSYDHMWCSGSGPADRWVIAALGGAYSLDYLRIWNYTEAGGAGRGTKTADIFVSETGFGNNVHQSSASFDATGFTRVLTNAAFAPYPGGVSFTNTDPHVSLNCARATHLAIRALENHGGDLVGLGEVKIYWASPMAIANATASNVAATTATLNGQLLAANWSCDVYVGWGTNNAGTNLASWATNKLVGTFNNYVGAVSNDVAGLTEGARYYYAFFAQSAVSNLCAQPAGTFQYSRATVSNTAATPSVGYASLGGTISDSVGSTVRTYWGDNDGGTNGTAWDYAITNGVSMPDGPFATNTPTGLLCGRQYFYRCYATNSLGESWAPATTPFFTAFPRGQIPASQIGTNVITQNEMGNREGYRAFDGTGMLDADYHNDNPGYSNMWCSASGPADRWVIAALGGAYNLDYLRIWNYTEAGGEGRGTRKADIFVSETGFGNNVHQSSASFDASGFTRVLANATFARYPGGTSFTNTDPHVSLNCARATHLAIRALSNYGADLVGLGEVKIYWASPLSIANRPPTNITPTSATLKADLIAEGWSCDVYVGWGTNDAGTNLTGWATNAFLGTVTNYTGPVSHDVQITPLTHYYYAFCVSNAMTNIWAQPSRALFNGAPAVSNTFATAHDFYADMAGTIRGANWATVRTYWGDNDGGTNMTSWDFVITNGISLDDCDFSASTTRDLRFFGNYYYRCYATNSIGESWAPDSTLFSPLPPPPLGPHDTILIIR